MRGKLAVFTEPSRPFELREYPVPEPGPEDIVVKVRLANICGSDLHMWEGRGLRLPPNIGQVPGHEMMGEIFALGAHVRTDSLGQPLQVGDRVVYSYFRPCNTCIACLYGDPSCPNRYRDWVGVPAERYPHFHGAYGQFYYLYPGHWVFKVPEELSDEVVSPVNCALAEVLYGLARVGVLLGDTVVVQGAGGLGLYATAIAREMGAGQVIVLDRVPARLELAQEFGADHTLNVAQTDPEERVARVREWTGGHGADVVVEVTGSTEVLQEGLDMLRRGGRSLWIGNINLGAWGQLQPETVVRSSRHIVGVVAYERWVIPRALGFLVRTQHRYPFHKLISHKFRLEDITAAFELAARREGIRVALDMWS